MKKNNAFLAFISLKLAILIILPGLMPGCKFNRIPANVNRVLKESGSNKNELLKVINYYRHSDSAKLEAAYYLIGNLPGHYYIDGQSIFNPAIDHVTKLIDQTDRLGGKGVTNGLIFSNMVDSIMNISSDSLKYAEDINAINAEYLIENIEFAFQAYNNIPISLRCDKKTFLRFVLPYRNLNEPIEPGLRKHYFTKYNWVFEKLEQYGSTEKVVSELLDSIDMKFLSKYEYPFNMPITKVQEMGVAGNCYDMVNLVAFILRSVGIPVTSDFTPQFGNNLNDGHEWLVIFFQDKFCGIDIPDKTIMNTLYKYDALPKIYRRCFENISVNTLVRKSYDVTDQYRNTSNISIKPDKHISKGYIAVFNKETGWRPVDESVIKNNTLTFNYTGRDMVYAVIDNPDTKKIIKDPFYLDTTGKTVQLVPDYEKTITGHLTRKYPPYLLRNLDKLVWVNSINGSEIHASNSLDFSDAICLKKITGFSTTHLETIKIANERKYKYYRFVSPDSAVIHLAELHIINESSDTNHHWDLLTSKSQGININGFKLVDNDPLTFIVPRYLTAVYYFDKPTNIREFKVQARNDDNHIKPGLNYELMYWDKGWISAGVKTAVDTILIYENLPSGALFWLRNLDGGREEQAFLLDNNGYQFWPGVSTMKDIYKDFFVLEKLPDY